MKNSVITSVATLLAFLFLQDATAQDPAAKKSFTVIGGKWAVCADTVVVKDYVCMEPYTGFEFLNNGRYREYPRKPIDPEKKFLEGDWTIESTLFTLDQDDSEAAKQFPKTYEIVWVNKDRFYASAKQGEAGPPLVVYFERKP